MKIIELKYATKLNAPKQETYTFHLRDLNYIMRVVIANYYVQTVNHFILQREKKMSELERHIREYIKLMENEPEGYIKISEVYHHLKRMIGDE